jgi:energy-coupling factor transport system substrate-specific component
MNDSLDGDEVDLMNKKTKITTVVLLVIVINYLSGVLTNFLKIPFFLDTWGTMLGVLLAGPLVAIIGGVLYNLIMAFTVWEPSYWVFMFSNIWVALITYYLYKKRLIDLGNPLLLICCGVLIGLTNAVVVFIIHYTAFGLIPTYEGTAETYRAFLKLTGNVFSATLLEKTLTEISDKLVSIFIAAFALEHITKGLKIKNNKKIKRG